ncbi:overproduction-induced pheromone-resistant [Friedmanniomyces endolithicus]|nr:overproduction-induced pheromone-resistant [Friedmanniomyces endolithicus]KAK0830972.1 overproduction-induced pheromone-resistant [Friedmanniomyces endolithicus]
MALPEERTMSLGNPLDPRSLFPRCLQCPDTTPSCPTCPKGEICSLVPADCNTCAYMTCITNPSPAPSNPGPNIGAIAGGVVGGVAAIAMIVFFVWRFWIKKRREQQEREGLAMGEWEGEEEEIDEIARQKAGHMSQERRFTAMHAQDTASTRTRGSLANSFLSRASNIIQIAYIPGVTNRNGGAGGIGSGHNSLLGNADSPVPPIPAATRSGQPPKSPLSNEGDMLFFRPGDLRDSSYSGASSIRSDSAGLRDTQYTRQSITPSLARSSMMSTGEAYRDSTAMVAPPLPATSVARAAPRMVSIKSSHSHGSAGSDSGSEESGSPYEQYESPAASGKGKGIQVLMPGEGGAPSTASSLRAKPKQITVSGSSAGGGKGRFPIRQLSDSSTLTSTSVRSKHMPAVSSPLAEIEDTDEEEEDAENDSDARAARRSMRLINTSLNQALMPHAPAPLVQPVESPFFDASELSPAASAGGMRGGPNPYASMAKSVGGGRVGGMGVGSGNGHLSDIIEEATRRASRVSSHEGLGGRGSGSPFSDAHATE